MPPSSVELITSLGLGASTSTGGTSLFAAFAGLGEACWSAEGRNEDRVANMTDCNKSSSHGYHDSKTHWYRRVVLQSLGVRQADRLVCKATGVSAGLGD